MQWICGFLLLTREVCDEVDCREEARLMVLVNDAEVDEVLFSEMLESGDAVIPVKDQLGDVLLQAQAGEEAQSVARDGGGGEEGRGTLEGGRGKCGGSREEALWSQGGGQGGVSGTVHREGQGKSELCSQSV